MSLPAAGSARCIAADKPETLVAPREAPAAAATGDSSTFAPDEVARASPGHIVRLDAPPTGEPLGDAYDDNWAWQWLPTGLIYHSYMAGPHEPRCALVGFSDADGGSFADATLGGRVG